MQHGMDGHREEKLMDATAGRAEGRAAGRATRPSIV